VQGTQHLCTPLHYQFWLIFHTNFIHFQCVSYIYYSLLLVTERVEFATPRKSTTLQPLAGLPDRKHMTYKSTRIYDYKLLERLIDFDSLINNSIAALGEFNETNYIEGHIGCTLDILYPDLALVDPTKGGWDVVWNDWLRKSTINLQRLTGKSPS